MKRFVLDRFNINSEFKPVNNRLINYYLETMEERIKSDHRTSLKYYSMAVLYVLLIVKNSICLLSDLDFDTRLKLFDISYIMGGIPKFNQLLFTMVFILGLIVSHKFHISRDPGIKDLLLLLNLLRGKMRVIRLFLDRDNVIILNRMTHIAQLIYSILKVGLVSMGKFFFKIQTNIR